MIYYYMIPLDDVVYDQIKYSLISRDIYKKPTLQQIIKAKKMMRIVHDGVGGISYLIIKMGLDFSTPLKGYHALTCGELNEELKDVKYLHNEPDEEIESLFSSTSSLVFTKVSDKSSVVDNGDHDISDNMTIVSRFKLTELPSADNESSCFISKASFGAGDKSFYAWVDKNGDKIHFMQSADGSAIGSCYTLGSMSKDVWYTVVLTFTSGIANIFVNTVKDTGSEATVASLFNSSYPLYIGSLAGSYYRFNGLINETSVYNKVLSQSEIDQIGTKAIDLLDPTAPSNLVSWHRMGDKIYDSGSSIFKVPDETGGDDATLVSLDLSDVVIDAPV